MAEYGANGSVLYSADQVMVVQAQEGTLGTTPVDGNMSYQSIRGFAADQLGMDASSLTGDASFIQTSIQAGLVEISQDRLQELIDDGTLERAAAVEIQTSEGARFVPMVTLSSNETFGQFIDENGGAIPDMNGQGNARNSGTIFENRTSLTIEDADCNTRTGVMEPYGELHGATIAEIADNQFVSQQIMQAEEAMIQGSFNAAPEQSVTSGADLYKDCNMPILNP